MEREIYLPKYNESRALIIGINKYQDASPLKYALNDAKSVKNILVSEFEFKSDNIQFLVDEKATKDNIMSAFLSYANNRDFANDKILFFFAGHGHTITSNRGEVGYLIPYNGTLSDLSTLIRWDELTRNADLITAKHVLFIMDACYGGLAFQRSLPPGSKRFLKDMLQRYSRQVLTAGKANETVSDSGGPLPNHSVFTGHLIEALKGKAGTKDGIITANSVNSYVYERVAKDPYSKQTPHYGFLDGDGDFIFKAPILKSIKENPETDDDVLIPISSTMPEVINETPDDVVSKTKEYLSENKIKLHDVISQNIREFIFNLQEKDYNYERIEHVNDEFKQRIKYYESLVHDLQIITICISHWGTEVHRPMLLKVIAHVTDQIDVRGGTVAWLKLRWYPIILLMYASGVSAIASNNYAFLSDVLTVKERSPDSTAKSLELALAMDEIVSTLDGLFKTLPGHERNYVPCSEYLFKYFQPFFEDILFLGSDYEMVFDKFEVFFALVCADLSEQKYDHFWGPPGRFVWKSRRGAVHPFNIILEEAEIKKSEWEPLKYGLFQGSYDHFIEIAEKYNKEIINKRVWL